MQFDESLQPWSRRGDATSSEKLNVFLGDKQNQGSTSSNTQMTVHVCWEGMVYTAGMVGIGVTRESHRPTEGNRVLKKRKEYSKRRQWLLLLQKNQGFSSVA